VEVHSRTHTKERPYFSKRCPMAFAAEIQLKKHILYDHANKEAQVTRPAYELPARCSVCAVRVSPGKSLKLHMKRQLRGEPFSCTRCDFQYPTVVEMLSHFVKDHAGSEDHILQCLFCGRKLQTLLGLENHTRVHTAEQPYFCSLCPKIYKQECSLKKHIAKAHRTA